ncbi:MAG: 4-hydroxy-3-methylbut-2-enyl diphosphate reductase [Desulfobacterales bacterium]|nr:4-hydroxy-3-methylbut-2-enyl diphosphate reductase [Desulfobacterales bacterium]
MKIIVAKTAGFCMGVKRAVEMVLDATNRNEFPIYTYGPLIHNTQVLELLEERGVSILNSVPTNGGGTILIRAHGVPPKIKESLNKGGFKLIDATCPRVIKVQQIISRHARDGYASIIVGDKDHPEVVGLLGYAGNMGYVVENIEELKQLKIFDKAIIVAQTTQNTLLFEEITNIVKNNFPYYKVFNTICDSTQRRQDEVKVLSKSVDTVVVVGGLNSGNTQRLFEIAKLEGKPVYHIETEYDLNMEIFGKTKSIGITAGASTPNWIINKIYKNIELSIFKDKKNLRRLFFLLQQFVLRTNLYVAFGAGALCYTCTKLSYINSYFSNVLIAMLYVLSMHILNNLIGRKSDKYNDPDRANFYEKNKFILTFFGFISGSIGLFVAYKTGFTSFLILLVMSVMGFLYNIKIIPLNLSYHQKIKDIPGSKTILIALAWGVVTSILPSIAQLKIINLTTFVVFMWSTILVFIRTSLFDLMDMQGDRIVGKETIPILLGEKKTIRFLKTLLLGLTFILLLSSILKITSNIGFLTIFSPIFTFIILSILETGYIPPGIKMEFLIDLQFLLLGAITFLFYFYG